MQDRNKPGSLTALSVEQLQNVRDQLLQQPLGGRSIHVPLGSQAFIEGRIAESADDMVRIRLAQEPGEIQTMTRKDALAVLQEEIDTMIGIKRDANDKPILCDPVHRKGSTPSTASSLDVKSAPVTKPSTSPLHSIPTYFEIREELDDHGKEIRGEAVDVSKQLRLLGRINDAAANSDQESLSTSIEDSGETRLEEVKPSDDKPKILSDNEYGALVTRLDQLAMMEEEADGNKILNSSSSRKLQSKGWSKGFLNKSNTPKTNKEGNSTGKNSAIDSCIVAPPLNSIASTVFSGLVRERGKINTSQPVDTTSDNQNDGKQELLDRPTATASLNVERSNKVVSFSGITEHVEIPRVGDRSVRTLAKPSTARPVMIATDQTLSSQIGDAPKKLSRFARQRQQQLS